MSILNLDGIENLKYPLYLIKELGIPFRLIVDKDFFVPYINNSLQDSRDKNGFPKYSNDYTDEKLIAKIITKQPDRVKLLELLKSNHSKALDLLEAYNVICMKYNLETDLVASDTASNLFYDKLKIPENNRTKYELLVNRYKQIKRLDNLIYVIDNTPHRNLPNSYKRIKNALEHAVKGSIDE